MSPVDPYSPPESNVETRPSKKEKIRKGWLVLFTIFLPLEIYSQYGAFILNEYNDPLIYRLISLIINTLFLTALFCLTFNIRVGSKLFWMCELMFFIVFDIYTLFLIFSTELEYSRPLVIFIVLIASPLIFLCWYSVYKYALFCDEAKS